MPEHSVVALSGGTGSAKFLRGLQKITPFTAIVNVADNAWFHGLYVCPDLDTVTYTLAGLADTARGWGMRGDRFTALRQLKKLGSQDTWFNIGDMDLATDVFRTTMMVDGGKDLTEVTSLIARGLGVDTCRVIPATDEHVETHIITSEMGEMHLQEYWVRERGRPTPKEIRFIGARAARPTEEVADSLASADRIIIAPANPLTSISPILSIGGFKSRLRASKARRVAISPMIGDRPFSGPAGKLMAAERLRPSSQTVAHLYKGLVDAIVIDESDADQVTAIQKEGVSCVLAPTMMRSREDAVRLARVAMRA